MVLLLVAGPSLAGRSPSKGQDRSPNGGWSAVWSPDGSQIAFLSSTPHTAPDLWVMTVDGKRPHRLTTGGVDAVDWSPDSSSIVVATTRRRFSEIFEVDLASGIEERVPGLPPGASLPRVSPDGQLFAFTAPDSQKIQALWVGTWDRSRVEMVTELLNVRSFFWGTESRRLYFEAGKAYGVGIWMLDLAAMQSRNLVNKYVGTPALSPDGQHIAFAYPIHPGVFELHIISLTGEEEQVLSSPRMTEKWVVWDESMNSLFYLGQDLGHSSASTPENRPEELHASDEAPRVSRTGEVAVWSLDISTGTESRVSPEGLHVAHFSISPDGSALLLEAVRPRSYASELYRLDLETRTLDQWTVSSPSWWGPAPSRDSRSIAYLTDDRGGDEIRVCDLSGNPVRAFPGAIPPPGTRLSWLPDSEALIVSWGDGMAAFADSGSIAWPNADSHRKILYLSPSLTSDKLLLDAVPRYGELPGLYELELVDGILVQRDLRFPPEGELGVEVYLQPSYSTDGREIAFSDRVDIWVMHSDGTGRRWITDFDERNLASADEAVFASHPVWSRRGDRICYTTTTYRKDETIRELWIVGVDGSHPKRLFREPITTTFQSHQEDYTSPPFFDLYDERIIITASRDGMPNLASISVDRGRLRWLTQNGAVFPNLLPDEDMIVYTSLEANQETLRLMDSDGRNDHALLPRPAKSNDASTIGRHTQR